MNKLIGTLSVLFLVLVAAIAAIVTQEVYARLFNTYMPWLPCGFSGTGVRAIRRRQI